MPILITRPTQTNGAYYSGPNTSTIITSTITPFYFHAPNTYNNSTTLATTSTNLIYYPGTSSTFIHSGFQNHNLYYPSTVEFYPKKKLIPIRDAKSSIKRALKLLDNFNMQDDIKIFLSGKDIEISHPDSIYKFVLSMKPGTLISNTEKSGYTTPYNLSLYTKTNIYISNLCVYLKDTPILDTVLAMAMFIKSGDEELLLTKANFYKLTKDIMLLEDLSNRAPYLKNKFHLNK